MYQPSETGAHVQTEWPTGTDDVRNEYYAAVERVRPIFVLLGAAEDLRKAGRWHRPSMEEWDSIEKAVDEQQEEHRRGERRGAESDGESDGESEGEGEGEGDGEGEEAEAEAEPEPEANGEHFPERILRDRLKAGQKAEQREFLIQWKGWSADPEDLTWQPQAELIQDGNAPLVYEWYLCEQRRGRKKTMPEGLRQTAITQGWEGEDESDGPAEPPASPPPQPPLEAVSREDVLAMLIAPIGSEQPNGPRSRPLPANASEAQRKAYNRSHVFNPATGQTVHKQAAMAHIQAQMVDAKPGAGHTQRYVTGERQPVIAEDVDGTGFECGGVYQIHVGPDGPLNSNSEILLDGDLYVGYARVLELRKLNGKRKVARLSVRASTASLCTAVVLPLTEGTEGQWVGDCAEATPVLVPLLSLGRRVVATPVAGEPAGGRC